MDPLRDRDDPFLTVTAESSSDFASLAQRPVRHEAQAPTPAAAATGALVCRLHGFDLSEQPLLSGIPDLPFEIVQARTTVPLSRAQVGAAVVVMFDQGDPRRPIVLGVLHDSAAPVVPDRAAERTVAVQADEQRLVLTADREIVLRCGDASITLTRAGKVLITGSYVLSRSTGYNKIKGAAVDIN